MSRSGVRFNVNVGQRGREEEGKTVPFWSMAGPEESPRSWEKWMEVIKRGVKGEWRHSEGTDIGLDGSQRHCFTLFQTKKNPTNIGSTTFPSLGWQCTDTDTLVNTNQRRSIQSHSYEVSNVEAIEWDDRPFRHHNQVQYTSLNDNSTNSTKYTWLLEFPCRQIMFSQELGARIRCFIDHKVSPMSNWNCLVSTDVPEVVLTRLFDHSLRYPDFCPFKFKCQTCTNSCGLLMSRSRLIASSLSIN